jgi:hypothetical protein
MAKVIQFKKVAEDGSRAFEEFLEELRVAYGEDRLRAFICVAGINYPKGEELPGFVNKLSHYWFSLDGSCTEALGLTEIMKDHIFSYMRDENANAAD